ncbi:MAG: histidinol-phosphate transaminase [Candidatus Sumerlaeaceae bacterium]
MRFPFRQALESLQPYPPGKPVEEVQREYGLTDVVKLASNENPYGPSPMALEAIAREAPELHLYPESGCHYLRQKLAQRLNVAPETLLFGNGSDEVVAMLAMAYLEPGANIVCSDLAFIRYEMGATSMGAATKHVGMKDWRHDVDALADAVDANTRFVFLANPDNPVGSAVTAAEVNRLLSRVPANVMVALDEAYYEYASGWSEYPKSVSLLQEHPNLIILRTFSKAYGLAGLRIGYAIAHPDVWDAVDRIRPPFNANRMAQAAANAALDDTAHLRRTVEGNAEGREYLYAKLDAMGVEYVPSHANFVLMDLKRPAAPVYENLLRRGVIVRPMGMYRLPNHLRVSVGLPRENEIFIEALGAVMEPGVVYR